MPTASILEFVAQWKQAALSERAGAQSHFIALAHALGELAPAEADPAGTWYTFERGLTKSSGGQGWADVWRRGAFAWEYKGPHKDLAAAYQQLLQYHEALESPPLLIVSDMLSFEVHTKFPNTVKQVYRFTLDDLAANQPTPTCPLPPLTVLRAAFDNPDLLHPAQTTARVTEDAAAKFAQLASSLRRRGAAPDAAAHFLMRLLFCLFAEDIGLLPRRLFTELVASTRQRPVAFAHRLKRLFQAMAVGDDFGNASIRYFDGGLFEDDTVLDLTEADLAVLAEAAELDWASVEPAIFGTLFERSLDPDKRGQLGAHYTSRADIMLIVEPVLLAPLRREWAAIQAGVEELVARRDAAPDRATRNRLHTALEQRITHFADRLAAVQVLDPACGSGNFLYVALKQLLDLEKEVRTVALTSGLPGILRQVAPEQLHGIELNPYAQQLASIVVWIGYIQWVHDNGFPYPSDPVLRPLHNIACQDAILAYDAAGHPAEPPWPAVDVIIGNPPFLGGNKIRQGLGDAYVNDLFRLYEGRVPAFADLVCYWFERARAQMVSGYVKRVGLLATQGIRGGANRVVLERVKRSGDIFWAQADRNWILDGANVHVSMVGFDTGEEPQRELDGEPVADINANLTADADTTTAARLPENAGLCFYGSQQKGSFDITPAKAQELLATPNSSGRDNGDVVKRAINGQQLLQGSGEGWVIDFGVSTLLEEAALYEAPFAYVKNVVYPERRNRTERVQRDRWWLHARPSPRYREILKTQKRYIATSAVAKHRIFIWLDADTLADHAVLVYARADDYFFGVLHSKFHEIWARRTGTQLREAESGSRYTPSTSFETFSFPWPPGQEPADDPRVAAIAAAARDLVAARDAWLHPPGVPEADLKARTLTALYNQRPDWLAAAHARLDAAVAAAYGWPADLPDAAILARLLALNQARAGG